VERSRRGKLHRAKQGEASVLSGAPYGYRYLRKTDETAAYYEVIETEADVVRKVFNWYTVEDLSIGAIARQLTEAGLPTRKQKPRWERSVIWAILRNPVGKDLITIKHSIPRQTEPTGGNPQASKSPAQHNTAQTDKSYLLCKGRDIANFGEYLSSHCAGCLVL
jgi:site-specific DNA recombinase